MPAPPPHGDPVGPFAREAARAEPPIAPAFASADLASTGCATELATDDTAHATTEGPQVKLVYARTPDATLGYAARKDLLQGAAARISQIILDASGGSLDLRWDTGTVCGPDTVDITSVTLPHPAAYYDALGDDNMFLAIGTDVTAALGWQRTGSAFTLDDRPLRNLAVFVDGLRNRPAFGGLGTLVNDESRRFDNVNNRGNGWAEIFPSADNGKPDVFAEIVLHEIGHTLGAVAPGAPHSTGAGHCVDEIDVMCYADGGPSNTMLAACGASAVFYSRFDCGGDDYFNVAPTPGSYLATRWNLADSIFLCAPARCQAHHPPPGVSVAVPSTPVEVGDAVTLTAVTAPAEAQVLHHVWDLDGDGRPDTSAAGEAVTKAWDAPGDRTVRVRAFNADGLYADATAVVTVNAVPQPTFSASAPALANRPLRLRAQTNATHGGLVGWSWSFGDGTPPLLTAQDEVDHTFPAAGAYTVALTATYADGATKAYERVVEIAAEPPEPPAPTAVPTVAPMPTPAPIAHVLSIRPPPGAVSTRRLLRRGLVVRILSTASGPGSASLRCGGTRVAAGSADLWAFATRSLRLRATYAGRRLLRRNPPRRCTIVATAGTLRATRSLRLTR